MLLKCPEIASAPPKYFSENISLKTNIGSLPALPIASQKIYSSMIASPITSTLSFFKFSRTLNIYLKL